MRKSRRLKSEMIRYIAFGLLVPVFLVFLIIGLLQLRYMRQATQENLDMLFTQVSSNVERALEEMNYAVASFTLDDEVNRALHEISQPDVSSYHAFVARNQLQAWIKREDASSLSQFGQEMILLHEGMTYDGGAVDDATFGGSLEWEEPLYRRESIFFPVGEELVRSALYADDPNFLLQCQGVRRFSKNPTAILFFRVRTSSFWMGVRNASFRKGALGITDRDGNLISYTAGFDPSKLDWQDGVHKSLYCQSGSLDQSPLRVHYQGPAKELFSLPFFVLHLLMVVFCTMLGVMVCMCARISRRFSSPIVHLKKQMDTIETKEMLPMPEGENIWEIRELERSYIRAQRRIHSLLVSIEKQVEEREAAYYSALQAQIRPHFLFNTLNAIQWKAKLNNDEEVVDVLSSLSLFLRHLYQNEEEFHSLKEEMCFLDEYVKVVNVRFSNAICFYHVLPHELEEYLIPKFCLQPLIENSFFHGFANQRAGMIVLRVFQEGNSIILSLADNGVGAQGNDPLSEKEVEKHRATGIGLSNIRGRLRHLYGDACGIEVDTKVGKGFHVTITIPMHKEAPHL